MLTVRGATWHCSSYPVTWAGRPDLSQCVSDAVLDIHGMVRYVYCSANHSIGFGCMHQSSCDVEFLFVNLLFKPTTAIIIQQQPLYLGHCG